MKNFTLKTLFSLLMLIGFVSGYSQEKCGMVQYMEEQMQNPEFAKEYLKNQALFKAEMAKSLNGEIANRGSIIEIPVAVHFPSGNEADRACLEALAQNQIDILNADYTGTNADIVNWAGASPNYPGVNTGAANISFCIATSNHPVGLDPELIEGNPAVTIGYNFGGGSEQDAAWGGYMNFLVKDIGGGLLGFSPLGGSIAAGQAVTMNLNAFGSGAGCPGSGIVPGAPYNLGRTVTHELGHFYNLNHSFTGSCGTDDGVADTPNDSSNGNYGCPSAGSINVCGNNILTMNYMDYVNDACMYLFTAGQTTRVDNYISGVLQAQLKPDVCGPADPGFNISGANVTTCGDSAGFDLTYTQVGGFSENTVFTAAGNPGGTTVSFTPDNLSANGSFMMTVNNLGGVTPGDYTITVTGTSTSVTKDVDFTLSVVTSLCASVANTTYLTGTQGVVFNTISNLNTGKPSGYSDYTGISTDVETESSYDLTVYANSDGNYQIITYVWIDWNQNCSFDDPGEQYDLGTSANIANDPTTNSPLSIMVPSDAAIGTTIMRVTTKYTDPDANQFPTSCENGHDAEVEDYTLNVMSALSIDDNEFGGFEIFPNPNKGEFTIKLNSYSGQGINVSVHDIRGRRIYSNLYDGSNEFHQTISLNSVQAGMYLVTVNDGDRKITKRIIVQ